MKPQKHFPFIIFFTLVVACGLHAQMRPRVPIDTIIIGLEDIAKNYQATFTESPDAGNNVFNDGLAFAVRASNTNVGGDEGAREELRRFGQEISDELGAFQEKKRNIESLRTEIGRMADLTIYLDVVSPTSSALGGRFTDIVLKSAESTLLQSLTKKKRGTLSRILAAVVNNPFVATFAESNPITGLVRDVVSQTISVSEGELQPADLEKFKNKLDPYLKLYSRFDLASLSLRSKLLQITTQLDKSTKALEANRNDYLTLLAAKDEETAKLKLNSALRLDNVESLSSNDVVTILVSSSSRKLLAAMQTQRDRYQEVVDSKSALDASYAEFKASFRAALVDAQNTEGIDFNKASMQAIIDKLK